jgi:hypothetical protein
MLFKNVYIIYDELSLGNCGFNESVSLTLNHFVKNCYTTGFYNDHFTKQKLCETSLHAFKKDFGY